MPALTPSSHADSISLRSQAIVHFHVGQRDGCCFWRELKLSFYICCGGYSKDNTSWRKKLLSQSNFYPPYPQLHDYSVNHTHTSSSYLWKRNMIQGPQVKTVGKGCK
jgi:hypothetical protein